MNRVNIMAGKTERSSAGIKCKTITLREKILRKLMGNPQKVTVIVPGEDVHMQIVPDKAREDEHELVCN